MGTSLHIYFSSGKDLKMSTAKVDSVFRTRSLGTAASGTLGLLKVAKNCQKKPKVR